MAAGILPEKNTLVLLMQHYCTIIPTPVIINFITHPLTCTSCAAGNEMGPSWNSLNTSPIPYQQL